MKTIRHTLKILPVLAIWEIWAILAILLSSGCAHVYTAHGAYYRVEKGDTLASIAQRHKIELQELAEANNIEHEEDLKPGRSLFIPGVTPSTFAAILKKQGIVVRRTEKTQKEKGREEAALAPEEEKKGSEIEVDHGRFAWPIQGELSSLFGMRRGRHHDGLDIRAKMGSPIRAAADGEVVYCKRMRGYGNLVLVRHDNDFFTVYAHNSVNLVRNGAKVKKGQVIAKVGRTGRATGPHVHFEVREGPKARNPLFFLPKTMFAQKAKERGETAYGGPEGEDDGEAEAENPRRP